MPGPIGSPSTSALQSSVSGVWASCTWLTRVTPPRASPAYQAKNPRNIEPTLTYAKPASAAAPGQCEGDGQGPGDDERPADRLRRAEVAREDRALGVADRAHRHRRDQIDVAR